MAARKPSAPRTPPTTPCSVCKGSGEVSRAVQVGRKRRTVGQQTGICLSCFGAGELPADD